MDPITIGVAFVASLLFGGISCSNDKATSDPTPDAGGDTPDAGPPGRIPDAASDAGLDATATPDPRLRAGANGEFADPTDAFQPCQIVDLDIAGDRITGMCGPGINRMFTIDIDRDSPLDAAPVAMGAAAPTILFGTPGEIVPSQVVEVDGGHVIPFFVDEDPLVVDEDSLVGGLSFIAPEEQAQTRLVDPVGGVLPYHVQSCIDAEDALAQRKLFCTAWQSGGGDAANLLSYGFTSDDALDSRDPGTLIALSGAKPVSITKISDTVAAIVRQSGADDGPAIDFVDLSAADPAQMVLATLPLPREPQSNPELAVSEDGSRAALLTQDGYLLVIDLSWIDSIGGPIADGGVSSPDGGISSDGGTVEVPPADAVGEMFLGGSPRDVAILGTAASVSNETAVQIVDIADPQNPQVTQTIDGIYGLGSIAVHSSGTIYVAATARWWEGEEAAAACPAGDPGAICRTHIVAIDPETVQPITPSPDGGTDAATDGGADGN